MTSWTASTSSLAVIGRPKVSKSHGRQRRIVIQLLFRSFLPTKILPHSHLRSTIVPTPNDQSTMGSVVLPHLRTGWHVDQAILSEEERLVVIRFGRDHDPGCMRQDEVLYKIADKVKNFAVIYLCDLDEVPDFKSSKDHPNQDSCWVYTDLTIVYELYDPMTIMFFWRNKHMMIDLGTGNNNKLNFVLEDKQELIDIIETVYRGAKKGRGLVISPKDYSTRYRY